MTLQILVMRVLIILILAVVSLSGCSSMPSWAKIGFLSPYKLDIRQGNYFTASMVDKLQVGMTQKQVLSIMGTPMVNDIYHANRWDYVYYFRQDGKETDNKRVTLVFDDDRLNRIVKYMGKDAESGPQPVVPAAGKV